MSRLILVLIGSAFLLVAGLCDLEYSCLGFPDGHRSEFDIETRNLRLATVWVNLAFELFACVLGAIWRKAPIAPVPIFAAALILVAVPSRTLPRCPQIQFCVSIFESITGHPPDDGGSVDDADRERTDRDRLARQERCDVGKSRFSTRQVNWSTQQPKTR